MLTVRCEKGTGEISKLWAVARQFNAALQLEDEDPDNKWFALTEYDETDEQAISAAIAEITTAYEQHH